jgi:hypothetical protein
MYSFMFNASGVFAVAAGLAGAGALVCAANARPEIRDTARNAAIVIARMVVLPASESSRQIHSQRPCSKPTEITSPGTPPPGSLLQEGRRQSHATSGFARRHFFLAAVQSCYNWENP